MKNTSVVGMQINTNLIANPNTSYEVGLTNYYQVECYDSSGSLRWKETIKNLVTTEGLDYLLNTAFKNGTSISSWYVGFKEAGAPASTDTAATIGVSPTAWTEYTAYNEATRPALTLATVSGGSVSNSGNTADITITSPAPDVVGVFIVDDNTKGGQSPATVLYGVGDFASARVVSPTDILRVSVTLTAASS